MTTIATPLYDALKPRPSKMNKKAVKSLATLKKALNKNVVVHIANFEKEFYISTNTSNTGLGAILRQKVEGKLVAVN
ncbi:hypothetical protein PAEPH01_2602 [Pancytospora epiphaga]|nr:hypothetical protein PAEPH01_2602 [Pancytospora epiphaga]